MRPRRRRRTASPSRQDITGGETPDPSGGQEANPPREPDGKSGDTLATSDSRILAGTRSQTPQAAAAEPRWSWSVRFCRGLLEALRSLRDAAGGRGDGS